LKLLAKLYASCALIRGLPKTTPILRGVPQFVYWGIMTSIEEIYHISCLYKKNE